MSLEQSARQLQAFEQSSLRARLARLETTFSGSDAQSAGQLCLSETLAPTLLDAALDFKRVAGQVNVVIHAVGILLALPLLLGPEEKVESLSLGAGNTGRSFDLVTNRRIAEFKFIRWRGGSETIRQNSIFKDFHGLAEADTSKDRFLYLLGLEHPKRFFNGSRALASVMSRNSKLMKRFTTQFGDRFDVVRDYYRHREHLVTLVDLLPLVPALASLPDEPEPVA